MSQQPPPTPTASAIGPCPTLIQKIDEIVVEENLEKATTLKDYFTEQTVFDDTYASLPATPFAEFHSLSSIAVSPDEEQFVLESLTIGKAAGPDSISNRLLKELAIPLSEPLCDLFNVSLQSGQVPPLGNKQMYRLFTRRMILQLSQTIAPFLF